MNDPKNLKFFSAFSGYGGFDIPLIKYGCECVGCSEIDKYAIANYKYNFKGVKNYGDISRISWEDVPNFDIFTGGFPCQDLSISGKREGLSGGRSGLFFEIIRCFERKKPGYFIIENVKGTFSSNGGRDLGIIFNELSQAGYDYQWQVLNAKNFGIPQNRERLFIIGHLRGKCRPEILPITRENKNSQIKKIGTIEGIQGHDLMKRCYSFDGIVPSLNTCGSGGAEPKFLENEKQQDNVNSRAIVKNNNELVGAKENIVNCLDSNYWKGADNYGQRTLIIDENKENSVVVHNLQKRSPDRPSKLKGQSGGSGPLSKQDGSVYCIDTGNMQAVEIKKDLVFLENIYSNSNKRPLKQYKNVAPTITSGGCSKSVFGVLEKIDRLFPYNSEKITQYDSIYHSCLISQAGGKVRGIGIQEKDYKIRRLTPSECEKLMGLELTWTKYGIDENDNIFEISDSQRYKLCGNGVVVNVVDEIVRRLLFNNSISPEQDEKEFEKNINTYYTESLW